MPRLTLKKTESILHKHTDTYDYIHLYNNDYAMVLLGFFVNRCLAPFMVEVTALVQEGVDLPSMDKAMRAFGMPVGPITLSGTIILIPPSPPSNVISHDQLLHFCLFTLLSESMTIFLLFLECCS